MKKISHQKRAFAQLQKSYGLKHPIQIKQRIILNHVLAIAEAVYGADDRNRKMTRMYRAQFKLCESQENLKG